MRNNQGYMLGRGLEACRDPEAVGCASIHPGLDSVLSLMAKTVPVSHHPHCEEFLPNI